MAKTKLRDMLIDMMGEANQIGSLAKVLHMAHHCDLAPDYFESVHEWDVSNVSTVIQRLVEEMEEKPQVVQFSIKELHHREVDDELR
jgi:hypothetical protein